MREAVSVFLTAGALETAAKQLELAGANRAVISVLSVDTDRSGGTGTSHRSTGMIADDPSA